MNRIKHYIAGLNKWQTIVLLLGIGVMVWLLIKAYLIKPVCLNSMCPTFDPTLWPRLGILIACTAAAAWLLKTPSTKAE